MERDTQEVTNNTSDYTDNNKPSHRIHSELKTGVNVYDVDVCVYVN